MKQGGQQLLLCTHRQGQLGSLQPVPSSRLLLCSCVSIAGDVLWLCCGKQIFQWLLLQQKIIPALFSKDVNVRCVALPGADEAGLPGLGVGR